MSGNAFRSYAFVALVGGLTACGQGASKEAAKGNAPGTATADTPPPPDTTRSTPAETPAPRLAAPAPTPPSVAASQYATPALVGGWDLIVPPGLRGPHLTVTIDSTRRSTFYGRLTRALSGDVELSSNFLPFKGTVDATGVVRFQIAPTEKGSPVLRFQGKVEKARMRLSSFVWAEEEQVKPDKSWDLQKAK